MAAINFSEEQGMLLDTAREFCRNKSEIPRLVHATNSPIGLPPNPGIAASEQHNLPGSLAYVNGLVGNGPFVMGANPTIADCTLLAGYNFARFGGLDILDDGYANLDRWFEMFALRHL